MQKIKKLLAFFLMATAVMATTSCGDDDEQTEAHALMGTEWQCQIREEWESDGENITWATETSTLKFDGETKGTFSHVTQIDGEEPEEETLNITYSFDGKEGMLNYMGASIRFVVNDDHLWLYDPEIEGLYYDFLRQ